jgi:hypothetical protein
MLMVGHDPLRPWPTFQPRYSMKHWKFFIFLGLVALVVALFAMELAKPNFHRDTKPRSKEKTQFSVGLNSVHPLPPSLPSSSPASKQITINSMPASIDAIMTEIETASTSYDEAAVAKIGPYLLHKDPSVRQAALSGMVNLGESKGAPILRTAAKDLSDPREATSFLEAADFLELPPSPLRK